MALNTNSTSEATEEAIPTLDLISPDAMLLRDRTAEELNKRGFKTSTATLATKAVRGGGPPFQNLGKSAVYRWGDVVAWVLETIGEPACTTSEHRARKASPPAPQKPSPDKIAAMVEGSRRYNAARKASATQEPRGPPGEAAAKHDRATRHDKRSPAALVKALKPTLTRELRSPATQKPPPCQGDGSA